MQMALQEAALALASDDIPVGAILVREGKVLAKGKNERELLKNPMAHAEVQAITAAAQALGHWNLTGAKLYVTLEPCVMCSGALVQARIAEVIYGASDPKGGSISLEIPILKHPKLNHQVLYRQGPLAAECGSILTEFFRELCRRKIKTD